MENKNRYPIRIAFPVPANSFGAELMIFLFCDEIELEAQEIINRYQEENPGLESKVIVRKGSSFPLHKSFTNEVSRKLLEDIRKLSSDKPFSLIMINHESCSGIDYSAGVFPMEDFFQVLAMREKLPGLLHEIHNLRHLSLYKIEKAGGLSEKEHKVRHLGDFF